MKKLGRYENSLFVFCGDHGEAFGEHAGNFGHTLYLYEENVRVPLVVFAPGLTTAQRRVPHLASVIDIAPTILDMLGLEIPSVYQGVSLLRISTGHRIVLHRLFHASGGTAGRALEIHL